MLQYFVFFFCRPAIRRPDPAILSVRAAPAVRLPIRLRVPARPPEQKRVQADRELGHRPRFSGGFLVLDVFTWWQRCSGCSSGPLATPRRPLTASSRLLASATGTAVQTPATAAAKRGTWWGVGGGRFWRHASSRLGCARAPPYEPHAHPWLMKKQLHRTDSLAYHTWLAACTDVPTSEEMWWARPNWHRVRVRGHCKQV